MKANKKKVIVLVAMVLLLVATGCLNYFLNVKGAASNTANGDGSDVTPTFFASYRTDRELTRQKQIEMLDEIIGSEISSEEAIANAEAEKLNAVKMMNTELTLEGLIKAKGFEDCIVTLSDENVNVVVMDEELTQEEAAMIMYIIVEQTGFTAPDISVFSYV